MVGMNIDAPANTKYSSSWMNDTLTGGNTTETSEIGIGYVPASASFLGGSGLALASTSNNTEMAWNLIVQMIDPEKVYLNIINQANGLYPPYDTSASYPPWSLSPFTVAREQVSHAVPMQYPHITFPQIADFENSHVFRQLFLNVVKKNATNSQAIDEACSVMMEILAPECNSSNWYPVYGDSCQAGTQNLIVSYEWTNSSGIACKGPPTLPSPIYVPCAYAVIDTKQSIAMLSLTSLCAIISLVYAVLLYVYRRTAVVKRASFMFCELVLFGSLFIYSTVYFLAGPATTAKCELVILVVVVGFALLFGSLFCKILRVYKIFNNKGFVALRLTDWYLLKRLAAILVIEAIGLIVLARVDGGPQAVMYETYTEPQTGQSIMQAKCVYGNIGALIYIAVFNLLLIVYAVALSIATWKVPTQYNESKFVIAASYAVGFGAILLAPLIFFVTDPTARLMIIGLTIDFGVVISVSIFCLPKIYTAIQLYRQETIRRRPGDTLDRIRSRRNCTCGEKHSWWKFWRHDSDYCSSQESGRIKSKTKPSVSQFNKRKSFLQSIEEKDPETHLTSRRTIQRGNIGHVHEEDVVRSTTVNSFVVDNHKDMDDDHSEDLHDRQDNELVLLNRPVNSLSRRSLNEQRIASNSATTPLHRRNIPPAPYTTFSPLIEQKIAHCPHCGIGFDARSI
ncbi:7 transmembrane sweet-taste receptor of 3 GCPR-domain-containing protein [Umbelopsis sp. AD052]|nr:7 transmembrane sweet-taste receptor of 3 GCPR-domain-containing protein [Umbelopsis sp. AD052]